MLAKEHEAVFIGDHGVGADERPRGRGGLTSGILYQDLNLSGRRDGANHVSHHIAKPQVAIGPPQRSLGKLESAADLFDLRILRYDRIERRIETNDTPDAVRFGHGRRCLGTANQQNGNGENKQSFHILHLAQKTLSLSRPDSLHSKSALHNLCMRLMLLVALLACPLIAREPLAKRIAHTDSEQVAHEPGLAGRIFLCYPPDSALPNHVDRLNTL